MFILLNRAGTPALMRSGEPLTYASRDLARRGKLALKAQYKTAFRVAPASDVS
jgi:hypothetical protein